MPGIDKVNKIRGSHQDKSYLVSSFIGHVRCTTVSQVHATIHDDEKDSGWLTTHRRIDRDIIRKVLEWAHTMHSAMQR